ncbi:MAG TPA: hypothetical protein VJH87_21890 [Vicinamibacteria bacterium]|nr:hypothetical protein [Vicinamibacteria bacterium]
MRPNEREFFSQVLEKVEDLPEGLSERLLKLVDEAPEALEERAETIRRLIEEHSRD